MNKKCFFCLKNFESDIAKKKFCNNSCQQEYWLKIRNKTGISTKYQRDLGQEIRKKIHLNPEQLQIVYGSLLGDASIINRPGGACRLKLCHCEKQLDYLLFKGNILKPFIIQEKPTSDFSGSNNPNSFRFNLPPLYHLNSIVHQDFSNIFGLFYRLEKGKKRKYISMNVLNKLSPLGILIWFLDDGHYSYQPLKSTHIMFLSTCNFSLKEHRTLKKWFWHRWRIKSVIYLDNTHNKYYLRFPKEGQLQFYFTFIKPFRETIPTCMHYKFPNF